MIVRLAGKLEFVGTNCVHVASGDFAYEVLVPAADVPVLQTQIGQVTNFYTIEYLEGNAGFGALTPRLIGFLRPGDRDFFELITEVKGIGNRKALRALSVPIAAIATAIVRKDVKYLVSLPEIGKRTAEQMIVELAGKVEGYATEAAAVGVRTTTPLPIRSAPIEGAIQALVMLGQRRSEAEATVDRVIQIDPSLQETSAIVQAAFRLRGGPR